MEMDKNLKILLIEDDVKACEDIAAYAETIADVELIGYCDNSDDGLALTAEHYPDVVILDLELHAGGGNGLFYLLGLRKLNLPYDPYILITTNNASKMTFENARQLGADFIITKYDKMYSAQYVIEFIRMSKPGILALSHDAKAMGNLSRLSPADKEQHIKSQIRSEMDLVGISPRAVGLSYLVDAIYIIMQEPRPNISRVLAEKYQKSAASIDRAMQNAINRAWQTNSPEDLLKYYKAHIRSDKGVPTMMEFVSYYANKLKG